MKRILTTVFATVLMLSVLFTGPLTAGEKIKIEKLDDLPRHTYLIEMPAVDLIKDDAALLKLAAEIKADMESDLATYEITDKATLKGFYGQLSTIAILEKRYDDALKYTAMVNEIEDKEALKLTGGMLTRAYVAAMKSGESDIMAVVKREYAALINALPYDVVEADLKTAKGMAEMVSEALLLGIVNTRIQPTLDKSNGELSKDIATQLLNFGRLTRYQIPYKEIVVAVIGEYLEANAVEKADIWAERDVNLKETDPGKPVTICIWDSGIDTEVYKGRMWTNEKEVPGNNIDDDKNGFVDDVHGIAYSMHSDKITELLYPVGDGGQDRPRLQRMMKGMSDLTANIESEECTELRKMLGSLQQDEAQGFIEDISRYGNHAHGTHVGGIAMRGNPFARMMAARLTFDYRMVPELPTIEQARKDSAASVDMVNYFKANGARVANMSWGGEYAGVESALETHNAGGTPEERKELARKIFEIGKQGLLKAMADAPEILFVTSAGNSDNDVDFDEVIPSSFDLPNMIVVGAVDQAGDETGFTSFGDVDVYANGFEVLSYVPGGDELKMSGTSQSSPQVTNLVGKILALKPGLTPLQVKDLIIKAADEKQVGERTIRLINPKKTMEMLSQM